MTTKKKRRPLFDTFDIIISAIMVVCGVLSLIDGEIVGLFMLSWVPLSVLSLSWRRDAHESQDRARDYCARYVAAQFAMVDAQRAALKWKTAAKFYRTFMHDDERRELTKASKAAHEQRRREVN